MPGQRELQLIARSAIYRAVREIQEMHVDPGVVASKKAVSPKAKAVALTGDIKSFDLEKWLIRCYFGEK